MLPPPVLGAVPSELESIFDNDEFTCAAEDEGLIYVVKVKDEGEGE